ncbi:MAG: hypothetical protein ACFFG0_03795 [Candidatus Thorarchaeota archaeon]
MGIILYKFSNEAPFVMMDEIDISNWRALIISDIIDNVIVVTNNCNEICIKGISLDEFHEINYCNKTVRKSYMQGSYWLPCQKCNGSGVLDWISNIVSLPNISINKFNYRRNSKGKIYSLQDPNKRQEFRFRSIYISTPQKVESQEYCSFCYGCGLNRINEFKILKSLTVEFC